MRILDSGTLAALAGKSVGVAQLVEMDITPPLYLNTTGWDLTWEGNTYQGVAGAGTIDTVQDTNGDIVGLNFQLSGVDDGDMATALIGLPIGAAIRLKTAIFDPATFQVLDAPIEWAGLVDVPTINEATSADASSTTAMSTVGVSAEHIGVDLMRPCNLLFSNADQLRLNPGDRSMEYIVSQSTQVIVWPAAAFFQQ